MTEVTAPAVVHVGIDQFKIVLVATAKLLTSAGKLYADGKLNILDFPELVSGTLPALQGLTAVKSVGEVLKQLSDVEEAEKTELLSVWEAEVKLPAKWADVEKAVELAAKIALRAAVVLNETIADVAELLQLIKFSGVGVAALAAKASEESEEAQA